MTRLASTKKRRNAKKETQNTKNKAENKAENKHLESETGETLAGLGALKKTKENNTIHRKNHIKKVDSRFLSNFIRFFLSSSGKKKTEKQADTLKNRLKSTILKLEKLNKSTILWRRILLNLNSFKSGVFKIKSTTKKEINKYLQDFAPTGLSGVPLSLPKLGEKIPQSKYWNTIFKDLYKGCSVMVYGEPGAGKTTFLIDYIIDRHRATGEKIAYVSSEQVRQRRGETNETEIMPSLKLLLKRKFKQGVPPDITFHALLPPEKKDVVIIDSINAMGLRSKDAVNLLNKNPDTDYIFVCQMTKSGDFKGAKDFEHLVDVVCKIKKIDGESVVCASKNRFGKSSPVLIHF